MQQTRKNLFPNNCSTSASFAGSFSFLSQSPNLDLLSLSILSLENWWTCLFLESKIKCYPSKMHSDAHPQSISTPLIPLGLHVFCVASPNSVASFTFSRKTTIWRKLRCQADIFLFSSFFFAAEYINYIGLTTSFNSGKFVLWVNIVPKDNVPGQKKVTSTVIRRITPENGYSSSALTPKRPLLYVANVEPYEVYIISFSVALVDRRDRLYRSGGAVSFLIRYVVLILSQPGFFVLQNEGGTLPHPTHKQKSCYPSQNPIKANFSERMSKNESCDTNVVSMDNMVGVLRWFW